MGDNSVLVMAKEGDAISGEDLQDSIDDLLALASALDQMLTDAPDVDAVQAIGRAQANLRSTASALVNAQIDLLIGKARITADHINGAVAFAKGVISMIADWKKRITKIGKLLDFLTVVLTGNGLTIVQAAVTLKGELDAG